MVRYEERLGTITDICLDLIRKDQESLDSVLARYPQHQDVLRQTLEAALWLSTRRASLNLRNDFLPASRRKLLRNIKQESATAPGRKQTFGELIGPLIQKKWAVQLVTAVLLIFILIIGSNSIALAAKYTIPGDGLYPFKLMQERVQLAFSFSASGDANLHIEFAQRRLVELQGVLLEGRYDYVPQLVASYQDHVAHAVQYVEVVSRQDPGQALVLITQLKEVFSKEAVALSGFVSIVPENVQTSLDQILEITSNAGVTVDEITEQMVMNTPTLAPSSDATGTQSSIPSLTSSSGALVPWFGTLVLTPSYTPSPSMTATFSNPFLPPYYLTDTPTPTGTTSISATSTPTPTITNTPKPTNTHRPHPTRKPTKTPKIKPPRSVDD